MASPQKENGFAPIANELIEQLAKINLSKYEGRVLWAIFRKTYGWSKKEDMISVSQLEEMTGLDRRNVSRTKKILLARKIITSTGNKIGLNKNYDEWASSLRTTLDIVYRDTRPKYFLVGFPYKKSDHGHCQYCFKIKSHQGKEFESHHIVPKSRGGSDCNENRILVCLVCHKKIHNEMEEWLSVNSDDIGKWYRHFMSLVSSKQTQFLSSIKTPQYKVKATNTKDIAATSAAERFSLEGAIRKMEEDPRRDMNIIALYFREKKPDLQTREQAHVAVKRHLRAAKQLKAFNNNQILDAIPKARRLTDEFTLETLVKVLTK